MGAGLARGLSHSDAARLAFLMATPIILAAGIFKLGDLLGPHGDGIRGQAVVACAVAAVAALFTVAFLSAGSGRGRSRRSRSTACCSESQWLRIRRVDLPINSAYTRRRGLPLRGSGGGWLDYLCAGGGERCGDDVCPASGELG